LMPVRQKFIVAGKKHPTGVINYEAKPASGVA